MVGEEKKGNVIRSTNDLEKTYGSCKRMLLLSHAFHKKRFNRKKSSIEDPNIPSAICPVPRSVELPIPEPCEVDPLSSDDAESGEESSISEPCSSSNEEFGITSKPHSINENGLNDLVRDLDLQNVKAELLASRLKQLNLVQSGVNVYSFHTRQQSLTQFFA